MDQLGDVTLRAAAFDPATSLVFASNGDGTLTVVKEDGPDSYRVVQNAATQRSARTMALEMGKPLSQGAAEAEKCASVCEYYAEHAARMTAMDSATSIARSGASLSSRRSTPRCW